MTVWRRWRRRPQRLRLLLACRPSRVVTLQQLARGALEATKALPKSVSEKVKPITIGVGESFTTTLTVVAYFALLITLPLILYEMYAFVLPALNKQERKVATPSMIAAPALFALGAVFTYFLVLPPAVHFLQGYNSDDFDILVQAKTYYKFEMFLMIGIGLAFQVPLLLLALQKLGLITSSTLTSTGVTLSSSSPLSRRRCRGSIPSR